MCFSCVLFSSDSERKINKTPARLGGYGRGFVGGLNMLFQGKKRKQLFQPGEIVTTDTNRRLIKI